MAPKTPVVPLSQLRVRVRTRGGRALANVLVSVVEPALSATTDAAGFARFALTEAQINATSPPGQVTFRAKKRHHGPDAGPGNPVVAGQLDQTVTLSAAGYAPTTPGLATDAKGPFLELVLIDAGLARGVATPGTPTRRLSDPQVQAELMALHRDGVVTLTPDTEFAFDHDTTNGEFDACDPTKCKLVSPASNLRVGIKDALVAGVKFLMLMNFGPSAPNAKNDKLLTQRFLRDTFTWAFMTMRQLDQRHVVGLARLCGELSANHSIAAILTQGVSGDNTRPDTHGFGQAIDFGGCCTALPDPAQKRLPVRLGTDFVVFLHWGRVPMWDGVTVKANPTKPALWKRLPGFDDGHDFNADATGAVSLLHYRLDPAPFQEPVPPAVVTTDATLAGQLAGIAPHFVSAREIFLDVYDFATREYSDTNSALGPLAPTAPAEVPTPIDSHRGHFILHPDYPKPNPPAAKNGRQAHVNHLHFQVGSTNFPAPRTP